MAVCYCRKLESVSGTGDERGHCESTQPHPGREPCGGTDVVRCRCRPVAQRAAILDAAVVDVDTTELHTECSRERRLHRACIRARMLVCVVSPCAQCSAGPRAQPGREQRGQPRGCQIEQIVEPRRRPPELLEARGAMTDTGVEGVCRAIAEEPAGPSSAPQKSGATTASEVFSATDSMVARAMPFSSSCDGSRPTRCVTCTRAAARSPSRSWPSRVRASRPRERPPRTTHVAPAVTVAHSQGRERVARSAAAPSATADPTSTDVNTTPAARLSA